MQFVENGGDDGKMNWFVNFLNEEGVEEINVEEYREININLVQNFEEFREVENEFNNELNINEKVGDSFFMSYIRIVSIYYNMEVEKELLELIFS